VGVNGLVFPWIETAVLLSLVAASGIRWLRDRDLTRGLSIAACGLTLACAVGAWVNVSYLGDAAPARFGWSETYPSPLAADGLSGPLLPLVALVSLLIVLTTLGAKVQQISFASILTAEGIALATLASTTLWPIIGLLLLGMVPPILELRGHRESLRVFVFHMAIASALLVVGAALLGLSPGATLASALGAVLLTAGLMIRAGTLPLHCWMTALFDRASFGTALLFVTPLVPAYAAFRLILPVVPASILHLAIVPSLATATYAAGMALVQQDARRSFSYLFLSNSSLVLLGLELATTVGVTAALSLWISVAASLAGFGLALRAVEARTGRLSLDRFHGLASHTPRLAGTFLVTGLASVGFPGTLGFVATELLVDGTIAISPIVGVLVVLTAALNGLAVMRFYFRVFAGTRHVASLDLRSRVPEKIAAATLGILILGGGVYPQPGISRRHGVAEQLLEVRQLHTRADRAIRTAAPPTHRRPNAG
jgi:NADH-quinone oxidoreductase subunit M